MTTCSLPLNTSLDGAAASLEAWAEVPSLVRERNDKRRRVVGMRRAMDAHEAEVRRVALAVGDVGDQPVLEQMKALTARAKTACEARAGQAVQQKRYDDGTKASAEAGEDARRAAAAFATLKTRLALPETDDFHGFLSRLEERARLQSDLFDRRGELARAGEGTMESDLREALTEVTVDAIEGRLAQLAAEAERLRQDDNDAYARKAELVRTREHAEHGLGSETATAHKSAAEIAIRETAHRYVVLKLGSLLLSAAVERHRAGQQDPLVVRAGALFADLTGGAYQGLDQTFDEHDQPILAGRPTQGSQVIAVENMSEGTRDQLFLALRLAYLEDYAQRAEPAPFIGDDIFSSFDDERTAHGIAALAAIGESVQPILFTHHTSVADIARRCLGDRADIIEMRRS